MEEPCPLRFRDYMEKEEFLALAQNDNLPSYGFKRKDKLEAVIHMGACSSTTEADASYLIRNNFEYTKQIALFCQRNKVRFIYASSAATYGEGGSGFDDEQGKLEELRPLNKYGYSKHLFDIWAYKNGLLDKIAGLKFFNVFGPNEYHKGEMRSLVLKAFEQVKSTGRISLFKSYRQEYKDGEQERDFIYVKDAADMVLHFLRKRDICGIYNVGTGSASTLNRLAGAIFKSMNLPRQLDYIDMPFELRGKYQYRTCAGVSKMQATGYATPSTRLEEAVEDYVKNYLQPGKRLGE